MQPKSSDHQFDFMLKNNQVAKAGKRIPKLPKPVIIGLAVVLLIIVLMVFGTLMSGRKNGTTQPIIDSVARGQEVIRVTEVVQKLGLHDPGVNALSSTVLAVLTSDHQQLAQYLLNNKVKVGAVQLNADVDKTVDDQMEAALHGNGLDQAYISYLQQYLPKYQTDLQTAYKTAPGPKGKDILKQAYDSETALLSTPPLKS